MAIKTTIDGVTKLDNGVWKASMNPSELSIFSTPSNNLGGMSVLVIANPEEVIGTNQKLIFEPQNARILNLGSSREVIILKNTEVGNKTREEIQDSFSIAGGDDRKFISDLSTADLSLRSLGNEFLREVRRNFAGELKFHPKSGKYVETPDNFWVVKIQPRDKSLRIVVRGLPDQYNDFNKTFNIKKDMTSYSSFKLTHLDGIPVAIKILRRAKTS
jgi:hypothetical protein